MGERRRRLDMDEALDPVDPIYKAIMKHPDIQASLIEPKFLDGKMKNLYKYIQDI